MIMPEGNKQAIEVFKRYQPVFNALGDPMRQQIMFLLANGTRLSVAELAAKTVLSRPAVSHHLKILSTAKLVQAERVGVRLYYRPMFQTPLAMARDFSKVLGKIVKKRVTQDISSTLGGLVKRRGDHA